MDYSAKVQSAQKFAEMGPAVTEVVNFAQSEQALIGPLQTSQQMWNSAGSSLDGLLATFPQINSELLAGWQSPADSSIYRSASDDSTNSIKASRDAIGSPAGQCTAEYGSAGIPNLLFNLADTITQTAQPAQEAVTAYNAAQQQFVQWLAAFPLATQKERDAQELTFVNQARPPAVKAGQALNTLAQAYTTSGPAIVSAAQQLKWKGPGAGNTISGSGAGGSGSQAGGPSGAGGGQGGQAGGQQGGQAGQQGGDQAGQTGQGDEGDQGDQAGQTGQDDQQGQDGQTGGQLPGQLPQVPGTGLAGMPTTPLMPPMEQFQPPNIPLAPVGATPAGNLPIGNLPMPIGLGGGGGRPPGGGGGGGIGGGGGGGGIKPDLPKVGGGLTGGDKQIARAGEQLSPQSPVSSGRGPGSPLGTGLAGSPSSGAAAGGGVPPMMPPGAGGMGAGGGGKPGKSGAAGTIRPAGRKRDRQSEETPGVPAGLRGKAGKDLPGAFPAVPANTRRRQEKTPTETLQLLDEDLWKVENPEPTQPHRYAN